VQPSPVSALVAFEAWGAALALRLLAGVAILVGAWLAGRLVGRLLGGLAHRRGVDPDLLTFLTRTARLALMSFAIVTAVGTVGVDVKALVAGLGLTGFALGFAFKDIISNLLAGVLILLYRPFTRGQEIEVAGVSGTVAEIDLRYTTLLREDGSRVLVPNANLFTNNIRVSPARSDQK
jgi:small-conductance mechanosensitive channel